MLMSNLTFELAKILYPLPTPQQNRTKELKVICCGIPRSGTESLHHALGILGYSDVAHGFVWWFRHINYSVVYYKLAMLLALGQTPRAESLRRDFFDRLLGDCEATTDVPTVWFCDELLLAYPDAKVVLNRRKDTMAWKRSFAGSVLPLVQSWSYWTWSWFNAELFWGTALSYELHCNQLFKRDFDTNAESIYESHYERLEHSLDKAGRPYLKWSVEDGWWVEATAARFSSMTSSRSPLCDFLQKSIPDVPFPESNVAAEFGPKLMVTDERRMMSAKKNASLLLGAIMGAIVIGSIWLRG